MMNLSKLVCGLCALAALAGGTAAGAATLASTDNGWYDQRGEHETWNINTFTGYLDGDVLRSWYVFDISALTGPVSSAVLTFVGGNGNYVSSDASETASLYDVTTDLAALVGGTGGTAAFEDLGSGAVYGTFGTGGTYTPMPEISLSLSGAAVADLNAAIQSGAGVFGIGAALISLSGTQGQEAFWSSSGAVPAAKLDLEMTPAVPLPAGGLLLVTALAGFGALRRRK